MEFNSLDAQRDFCEAYIASQRAEGWACMRERYDDGGFSGGTLDRPGLKMLIEDIEAGLVDVIVVYKIDRLSRSLMDFAKLVEVFDRHGVTFVSVTQSFNTTTSMGRLTLNILLSFAQFEREVTGERIRDKFAASRAKGMWMGGFVPMGYDVVDRKLVINELEAATVRSMFQRFVELGSATLLTRELVAEGVVNKRGRLIDKGYLYKLFRNRVYIGEAVHKGTSYPGEHEAMITLELWEQVLTILKESPRARAAKSRTQKPSLLRGIDVHRLRHCDDAHGYEERQQAVSLLHLDRCDPEPGVRRRGRHRPAQCRHVEGAVVQHIRSLLRTPEIAARAVETARRTDPDMDEHDVVTALAGFDGLWETLFPAEQARIAVSTRGTHLGLFGNSGSITRHSKSVRSYRLIRSLNQNTTYFGSPQ